MRLKEMSEQKSSCVNKMGKNTNVSIQSSLYKQIKEFVKARGRWPSPTAFIEESTRLRLEELKKGVKEEEEPE